MESLIRENIVSQLKDFLSLREITKAKDEEIKKHKKNFSSTLNLQESVEEFSNLVADFTIMSRDSQLIFMKLFNTIELYNILGFDTLTEEVIEFYNKNKEFFPKTIFILDSGEVREREEGSLKIERDKFLKSDYLKNLINAKD